MTVEELEIIIRANITDAVSGIRQITNEVKNAVNKSIEPMKQMTSQAKETASKSVASMGQMKQHLKQYNDSINDTAKQQTYLKSKIQDLQDLLARADMGFEVGDTLKIEADIEKLQNRLRKLEAQSESTAEKTGGIFSKIGEKIKIAGTKVNDFIKRFNGLSKGTKGFGNTVSNTFSKGIKSIKKFTMGLLGIRTAYTILNRAVSSYLNYDSQLSDSISNCWNVLGSLLAPILERIINLFSTLVSYVNAFVKALTGIDLVARANAKSLNSQAKATKNASRQLSGLDDLNNLTTNDGGGGGDNKPITVQDVDLGNLDKLFSILEKVREIASQIFDPFKKAWDNKGQAVIESIKNAFNGIKDLGVSVFSSIFEVWTNGTGQKYIENQLQLFTNLFNIVGSIGKALSNAWDNAGNGTAIIQAIADIIIYLQDIINSITESLLNWTLSPEFQEALNVVVQIISDIFGWLSQIAGWIATMYETYLAPVVDKILACISKIIIAIGSVWDFLKPIVDTVISVILDVLEPVIDGLCGIIGGIIDALSGVMDFITGVFTGDWEKAWNGLKQFLSGIIDAIVSLFKGLFDIIVALFKGAWDIIKSIWSVVSTWFNDTIIKPLTKFFSNMWNNVKTGAKNAWEGIKSVFSSVATFFGNIFSTAWNKVKAVFSSGGKIFEGIKDGIFNAFKSVVNVLIGGINKIVAIPFNAINKALKTVRDISFLGIAPFKGLIKLIDVPQIPSLADGGVLTEETLVRVAEYSNANSNPEIVSPANLMDSIFRNALSDTDLGTRVDRLTIKFLDENVYDGAIEYINEQSRIKGVSVIKEVD